MKFLSHIHNHMILADRECRFLFMANRKVCLHSIARHALADRIVIRKDRPTLYKKLLGRHTADAIRSMFSFTVVRNPWDKLVSAFFANTQSRWYRAAYNKYKRMGDGGFAAFVREKVAKSVSFDSHIHHQYHKAYFRGSAYVDFIARFENIEEDWGTIAARIGYPDRKLPHANASVHGPYRDYYDKKTRDIVAQVYGLDISVFGYEF